MTTQIEQAETFRARTGGLALAGLILAYCLQPLIEHANRSGLAWGGFLLALGVATFWQLDIWPSLDQSARKLVAAPLAAIGTSVLIITFCFAAGTAEDFDAECRMQQLRMTYNDTAARVGDKPATGHDTYAAMRCRWVPLSRPKAQPGAVAKAIPAELDKPAARPSAPVPQAATTGAGKAS